MKYFIKNIEKDIWYKNREEYWVEFSKIKEKLPKRVVEVFIDVHDAESGKILLLNRKKRLDIAIELKCFKKNPDLCGYLIHEGVADFKFNMDSADFNGFCCEYRYGEILLDNDNFWTHNFTLFSQVYEIFIKCKKIKWIDIEKADF